MSMFVSLLYFFCLTDDGAESVAATAKLMAGGANGPKHEVQNDEPPSKKRRSTSSNQGQTSSDCNGIKNGQQ